MSTSSKSSHDIPNVLFTVWAPVEVAECLIPMSHPEGPEIYYLIWNKILPLLPSKYESESGEIYEEETLAAFWSHFTPLQQVLLNEWAKGY